MTGTSDTPLFSDEDLMVIALSEAAKVSKRQVLPNPRVGAAILTKEGKLFFAHHKRAGESHAEILAILAAQAGGANLAGATIAVTLEPCSHVGRTPPCADALVKAGFARVIIGIEDPDPRVSGTGIQKLLAAGIEVIPNVLRDRCSEINKEWLHAKATGLPYVYLKMATSMDGLWTAESGESQWITGEAARAHAHRLRGEVGAIVTSMKTIADDDPLYTARDESGQDLAQQPDLAVISRQAEWPEAWASKAYRAQSVPGREIIEWKTDFLRALFKDLLNRGHVACMIEAGPELSAAFLNESLVNEIWHYRGARLLGGEGLRMPALAQGKLPGLELEVLETRSFADGDQFTRSKLRGA